METKETHYEFVRWLKELGRTSKAIEMLPNLLQDQRELPKNNYPKTLSTAQDTAYLLGDIGKLTNQ